METWRTLGSNTFMQHGQTSGACLIYSVHFGMNLVPYGALVGALVKIKIAAGWSSAPIQEHIMNIWENHRFWPIRKSVLKQQFQLSCVKRTISWVLPSGVAGKSKIAPWSSIIALEMEFFLASERDAKSIEILHQFGMVARWKPMNNGMFTKPPTSLLVIGISRFRWPIQVGNWDFARLDNDEKARTLRDATYGSSRFTDLVEQWRCFCGSQLVKLTPSTCKPTKCSDPPKYEDISGRLSHHNIESIHGNILLLRDDFKINQHGDPTIQPGKIFQPTTLESLVLPLLPCCKVWDPGISAMVYGAKPAKRYITGYQKWPLF